MNNELVDWNVFFSFSLWLTCTIQTWIETERKKNNHHFFMNEWNFFLLHKFKIHVTRKYGNEKKKKIKKTTHNFQWIGFKQTLYLIPDTGVCVCMDQCWLWIFSQFFFRLLLKKKNFRLKINFKFKFILFCFFCVYFHPLNAWSNLILFISDFCFKKKKKTKLSNEWIKMNDENQTREKLNLKWMNQIICKLKLKLKSE